jgi:hypothetical protein
MLQEYYVRVSPLVKKYDKQKMKLFKSIFLGPILYILQIKACCYTLGPNVINIYGCKSIADI